MAPPKPTKPLPPKKAKKLPAGVTGGDKKVVASNKRAYHDYEISETIEAGIVLYGSEVKALRDGKAQLKDSYARIESHEMLLVGLHIPPYSYAHGFGAHNPDRSRKLLLHRDEIDDLGQRIAEQKLTLLPLSIYFLNGRAKIELGLGRGRKTQDKRSNLAERDAQRDIDRAMADSRRAHAKRRFES
jgi:SsrA-binding protein